MGTVTYQIATEANTESSYGTYINSTTTNKKCITVNRLLQGLISTSNTPSYVASDFSSGYTLKYDIKTWGSSAKTVVDINDSSNFYNSNTSQIIETTATDYCMFPFSTGTAFLAIKGNQTITGTVVFTYGQRQVSVNALSTDDVSPASMDFDNPEEDTELNNDGQEPTVAGNMSRVTINGCTQASTCTGLDGSCVANETPGGCTIEFQCPSQLCLTEQCLIESTPPCSCQTEEEITHPPFTFKSIYLYLQIYDGVDSLGNDTYRSILDISGGSGFSATLEINNSTTKTFSINIPTSTIFPISGSPNGTFKFRIYGNFGNDYDPDNFTDGVYVAAQITVNMPLINFVVYNPGPKCIQYNDLSTVYKLYGKTV